MSFCEVSCKVVVSTLLVVWAIIGILFVLYHWRKLHFITKFLILKKRYVTLIYLEFFLVIILFIDRLWFSIEISFNLDGYPIWFAIFDFIGSIVFGSCFHGIYFIIILRAWHMYFDLNYYISSTVQWKSVLNSTVIQSNWFIKNKGKYGNHLYTIKYILIPIWFIDSICSWTVYISIKPQINILPRIAAIMMEFPNQLITNIIIWILYCKVPQFYDSIFLKTELKYTAILYTTNCIFGYFVIAVTQMINDEYLQNVSVAVITIPSIIVLILPILIIIPHQIRNEFRLKFQPEPSLTMQSMPSSSVNTEIIISSDIDGHIQSEIEKEKQQQIDATYIRQKIKDIQLIKVFKYEQIFELFMVHLQRELSTECLLSFCELLQFRKLLCDTISCDNLDTDTTDEDQQCVSMFMDCFYLDFPKSDIVYKDVDNIDNMNKTILLKLCKEKYRLLFKRYIESGSALEINISFAEKMKLFDMIQNIKEDQVQIKFVDLRNVFDVAIKEMYILMLDAFMRFKMSNNYLKIYEIIFIKKQSIN